MKTKIALMGAGGKMGSRITDNLLKHLDKYEMYYIEVSEPGIANLAKRGLTPTPQAQALANADAVILALPDKLIGKITQAIVPTLKPGTLVIGLDPAAAYAGVIPIREDLSYFVSHPCHPPLFSEEVGELISLDWFGGVNAKMHIVSALHSGKEEDYARGDGIARDMYAPVMNNYRITVEQMAILEPALVETFAATCITAIKEAYDEAVKMGVPPEAAWEFLAGHARIEFAIVFGFSGFPFSDGAKLAAQRGMEQIIKPDWKQVFEPENVMKEVRAITEKTT